MEYSRNSKASQEERKRDIKPVASGSKTKKNKFWSLLIADDAKDIKSYLLEDVLVPAVKNGLSFIISESAYRIFGVDGYAKKRNGSGGSKVSYDRFYGDRKTDSRGATRLGYSYDDVAVDTFSEAEIILNAMDSLIDQYDTANVADFYELAGIKSDNYTDNNYGWDNLSGSDIIRARNGQWIIKMPKPMPLNTKGGK